MNVAKGIIFSSLKDYLELLKTDIGYISYACIGAEFQLKTFDSNAPSFWIPLCKFRAHTNICDGALC